MQPSRIHSGRLFVALVASVAFGAPGWACSSNEVEPIAEGEPECHLYDDAGAVSAECADVGPCAETVSDGRTAVETAQADAGAACAAAALALGAQDTWSSLSIPKRYEEACARARALIEPAGGACSLSPCKAEPVVASCTFSPPIDAGAKSAFEAALVGCCKLSVVVEAAVDSLQSCFQVLGSSNLCAGCAVEMVAQIPELTNLMQASVCGDIVSAAL